MTGRKRDRKYPKDVGLLEALTGAVLNCPANLADLEERFLSQLTEEEAHLLQADQSVADDDPVQLDRRIALARWFERTFEMHREWQRAESVVLDALSTGQITATGLAGSHADAIFRAFPGRVPIPPGYWSSYRSSHRFTWFNSGYAFAWRETDLRVPHTTRGIADWLGAESEKLNGSALFDWKEIRLDRQPLILLFRRNGIVAGLGEINTDAATAYKQINIGDAKRDWARALKRSSPDLSWKSLVTRTAEKFNISVQAASGDLLTIKPELFPDFAANDDGSGASEPS